LAANLVELSNSLINPNYGLILSEIQLLPSLEKNWVEHTHACTCLYQIWRCVTQRNSNVQEKLTEFRFSFFLLEQASANLHPEYRWCHCILNFAISRLQCRFLQYKSWSWNKTLVLNLN